MGVDGVFFLIKGFYLWEKIEKGSCLFSFYFYVKFDFIIWLG